MTDPYSFEQFSVNENNLLENESIFNLNKMINTNLAALEKPDFDLKCFTTDQLQKIQNENFSTFFVQKEKVKSNSDIMNSISCKNCKTTGLRYRFYKGFCSEFCSDIFRQRKKMPLIKKTKEQKAIIVKNKSAVAKNSQLNKVKARGRPCKVKTANIRDPDIYTEQKMNLQEAEIKESVYLARTDQLKDASLKFKYNSQLLLGIHDYLNESQNYNSWCIKDVSAFIRSIPGCSKLAQLFESEVILFVKEIDGEALLLMQESDLTSLMNIKLGPAIKIFNYILKLRNFQKETQLKSFNYKPGI